MTDDDVVAAFNELGYSASFAAVRTHLAAAGINVTLDALYIRYPSREALAEQWLASFVPLAALTLRNAFIEMAVGLLRRLESRRDFSKAWLASMPRNGPLHLRELQNLHDYVQTYFVTWLDTHQNEVSIPADVPMLQAKEDISHVLTALVFWLFVHWESDGSTEFDTTKGMAESIACLVDGLLMGRADFGGAGLLFHLHRLFELQHQRFLLPLLDTFLTPTRAARLVDPVSLLEVIRTLTPSPVQRP